MFPATAVTSVLMALTAVTSLLIAATMLRLIVRAATSVVPNKSTFTERPSCSFWSCTMRVSLSYAVSSTVGTTDLRFCRSTAWVKAMTRVTTTFSVLIGAVTKVTTPPAKVPTPDTV